MSQRLFDEADRLEANGQNEQALAIWRELAASNPTRNVYLRLAGCANKLGLIEQAEDAFASALEVDSRSVRALAGLGILAIERNDYGVAEEHLRRACALEADPGIFTLLGVALSNMGKDLEAEDAYRTAINIDPAYEEAYFNLGVLIRQSRPSEARLLLQRAVELDPDFVAAHVELRSLLHDNG